MSHSARVVELRARISALQSNEPVTTLLPTRPDLARMLPGGGLKAGAVYQVQGVTSLLFAAFAAASREGNWCALVGWPHVGVESMHAAGVSLDRCVLVPRPGERWLHIASTLADAMPLVAVRSPKHSRIAEADASRLAARLRERGSTLLIDGNWPGVEASIQVQQLGLSGLEQGFGLLRGQDISISVRDRAGRVRTGSLQFGNPPRIESANRALLEHAPVVLSA